MKPHAEIQDTLYDFVMNDLGAEETEAVRRHLLACRECQETVKELAHLVAAVPRPHERPSDRLDETHWSELAARIERKLPPGETARRAHALTLRERFRMLVFSPRPAIGFAMAALTLAITATLVLRPWERQEPVGEPVSMQAGPVDVRDPFEADIAIHLRRSKNLLVGLANTSAQPDAMADLSVEREASRQLLIDNRRYRSEVLDPQSSEVLADLERIMIEVANSREHAPAGDLELIRQGIRQQNLLFKVRMAERLSSRGMIVRASGQMMQEE